MPGAQILSPVYAIVPAAGSGSRLRLGAGELPKPLRSVAGRTVLERTLDTLAAVQFETIYVLVPADSLDLFRAVAVRHFAADRIAVIPGGASRRESVRRGLAAIGEASPPDDTIVLVHDAARCFAGVDLMERSIAAARQSGAVSAALPLVDSIKRASAGIFTESLSRSDLWLIQTPQVFRYDLLVRAHDAPADGDGAEVTDDAGLVERFAPVGVVRGERLNFKITEPDDLQMAEIVARASAGEELP